MYCSFGYGDIPLTILVKIYQAHDDQNQRQTDFWDAINSVHVCREILLNNI